MLKTYSESDAKKLPKGSQKGCQEASKIEILGAKMGTRSDVSTHSVSQAILKRIFMKNDRQIMNYSAPVEAGTLKLRNRGFAHKSDFDTKNL